jgi:hypothetical protein
MVQHTQINKWNTAHKQKQGKNDMIISIGTESLWQNSTSCLTKSTEETRNERSVPQHNKDYI